MMGSIHLPSVVNKYLQAWDLPNLFVVGGTRSAERGAGRLATIGMLACWAADGIKEKLWSGRGEG